MLNIPEGDQLKESGDADRCNHTAGIILAAGDSSRYGTPKALLEWRGHPLIWHVARAAKEADLSPLIVVLGAVIKPIIDALVGIEAQFVNNLNWRDGQSQSLRVGIEVLPLEYDSAIILLADQPQISTKLLHKLIQIYWEEHASIVIPRVKGKRGNPVLFDRAIFPDLCAVKGDVGGRVLFSRYPVTWLEWDDASILMDVDTPEDYQRLLELK